MSGALADFPDGTTIVGAGMHDCAGRHLEA